jgi:hypothetical protein
VVGVDLTSVGRIEPESDAETVIAIEDAAEHRYRKLVIADGAIAGAILFGEPLLAPVVTAAIKRNVDVTSAIAALQAGDWQVLADLPERGRGAAPPAGAAVAAGTMAAEQRPASQVPRTLETPRPGGAPRLVLTVDAGPASGTVFEVGEAGATLGRTSDNLVYILDQGLSRVHARFECRDGGYWLLDLASTNGTFVNQQRVESPRRLNAGDVIRVGRSRLIVRMKDEG